MQNSIKNGQKSIEDIRENNPGISDASIEQKWNKAFQEATQKAEKDMNQKSTVENLTWEQVFQTKYIVSFLLLLGIGLGIYNFTDIF